jgi:alpha-glucoside transport system substrate-binding protein
MRSRSRVRSLFVPLAIVGAFGAASVASAGTDTTTPEDTVAAGTEPAGTAPAGTEPAGTEPAGTVPAGTEPMGTEPTGSAPEGGAGPGVGSGADSGIEGADLEGTEVSIISVETSGSAEGDAVVAALNEFGEANGITINYVGTGTFEDDIGTQVSAGTPPDIAAFPQPGFLASFARTGDVLPLPDDVLANVSENWPAGALAFANVDGTQYGVPIKSDLKSLVWYMPASFAEAGYEVPETLDDFFALTEQMIANGDTPLCVGIEDGAATGWPFTDWVEELVLRNQGIDFYNQWTSHEIPFNSPEVVEAMQQVVDFWNTEGMVFAAGGSIAATAMGENGDPLVAGDCMMHRQANFYAAFITNAGAAFGDGEGEVNTFYFPGNEGRPTLVGGINVAAFRDAPEVWAVMQYLGSPEFANARQVAQSEINAEVGVSGFLTANLNADPSLFNELEQGQLEILQSGDPIAFDGSDLMPGEVGAGTFWSEGVALVNGDITAQEAADNIEASWPAGGASEEAPATTGG